MKKILYGLMSLCLVACDPAAENTGDVSGNNEISLSAEALSFLNTGDAIGDIASVTVTSSGSWTLIGKTEWCHPSVKEGTNGDVVTFTADANSEKESRSTTFSFVCGDRTAKLNVMQKENDVLEFYNDTYSVGMEGGEITVRVSSSSDFEYSVSEEDAGWIVPSEPSSVESKAVDLHLVKFTVNPTDEYVDREGKITFTCGRESKDVTVLQDRLIELKAEQDVYQVEANGGELVVKVSTNLPYTVTVPDAASSWLSFTPNPDAGTDPGEKVVREETFTISVQGEMTRAGKVTLTSADGSLVSSFIIMQKGSSPKVIEIPDDNFRAALADLSYVLTEGYEAPQCELTDLGQNAKEMNVSGKEIHSLEGIKNFPKVETLDCSNNYITHMDFRDTYVFTDYGDNYSNFDGNPIEEFIANKYIQYVKLQVESGRKGLVAPDGTASTKLRISGEKVTYVYVQYNKSLTKLDVSGTKVTNSSYCGCTGCAEGGRLSVYFPVGTYINSAFLPKNVDAYTGAPSEW